MDRPTKEIAETEKSSQTLLHKFLPISRPYGIYPAFGRKIVQPKKARTPLSPLEKYAKVRQSEVGPAVMQDGDTLGTLADQYSTISFSHKNLEVRLARSSHDVRRAQRLRYKVFYEEMNAIATAKMMRTRRDADEFDPICDHFLVLDHGDGKNKFAKPKTVGTYRILRQELADHFGGFYSQSEYDLEPLIARHPDLKFCELGRSCVLKGYRDKRTLDLLWQAIWAYAVLHDCDVFIGVASLHGTNVADHAEALSFLHHNYAATKKWSVSTHPDFCTPMNIIDNDKIDARTAMGNLPPLIKGYLRLGAYIGDGAFVDTQFDTTDVLIIQPLDNITSRYAKSLTARTGFSRPKTSDR